MRADKLFGLANSWQVGRRLMKKKWLVFWGLVFIAYCIAVYYYIFHWSDTSIPSSLQGSAVDPQTFMSKEQLAQSNHYSNVKNLLFFVLTPLEWLFYVSVLVFGVSRSLENWSMKKGRGLRTISYVVALSFITFLFFLPIKFYSYRLGVLYNLSTQSIASWLQDSVIDFVVDLAYLTVTALVLFWLIRRFGRKWWFYAWILTVPFTIFMMFIQPVVIDPLYNDFYQLKDKALEQKILSIAHRANIPAEHVFEVNMSEKTNTLNAYVTGIGANSRIVLWDTTLEKLSDDEILFVMAHEMGHYVKKDIYQGMGIYLAASFVGLWLVSVVLSAVLAKKNNQMGLTSHRDMSVLPFILLLISILSFIYSPIDNSFSRMQESRADRYALEMTHDPESGVSSFQKLSSFGLTQVNPPFLVKLFRYGHPTMLERLIKMDAADSK